MQPVCYENFVHKNSSLRPTPFISRGDARPYGQRKTHQKKGKTIAQLRLHLPLIPMWWWKRNTLQNPALAKRLGFVGGGVPPWSSDNGPLSCVGSQWPRLPHQPTTPRVRLSSPSRRQVKTDARGGGPVGAGAIAGENSPLVAA